MIKELTLPEFLEAAGNTPVVDVRTPAEFEQGHIAGAHNIPVFSNEERAHIGTLYKQQGKQVAILAGFECTGPKWAGFIREAERISPGKRILVHCWRGGMRSGAMAWAFDLYGFSVATLKNGYKAYRKAVLDAFTEEYPFVILGGYTGTAKTRTLLEMRRQGEQVIDLEELAQHQGSAFGSMGRMKQPSQEQFENLLAAELSKMDREKRIWLEDESVSIGKRVIPKSIFQQMSGAEVIRMEIPKEERIRLLDKEYGSLDRTFLKESVEKITRRLGDLETRLALQDISEGRMEDFIRRVLVYYDKSYRRCQDRREPAKIHPLGMDTIHPEKNAQAVIDYYNQWAEHGKN